MTTLTQIDKFSDKWFGDSMRRRGFAVERKFVFWRKRGPLFDMFLPQILTGGELLRVHVTIWSPWADSISGELGKFPPDACLIGGTLSDEFPLIMKSANLFEIENEESLEKSLRKMLYLIDNFVLPWFPTVNSFETYSSYIGARGFNPTKEYQKQLRGNMERGFKLEPYL